ncbi:MAG: hypothetical protein L0H53_02145 [Candidatus Nitrosocosmicus sp.]|nr:hypothetical protein [Candidatus Nitrosocosmicus sp.]
MILIPYFSNRGQLLVLLPTELTGSDPELPLGENIPEGSKKDPSCADAIKLQFKQKNAIKK